MTEAFRLLIVDDVHPLLIEKLSIHPFLTLDYQPNLPANQVAEALKTAHGLVIRSKCQLTGQLMAAAPKLKFIARAGAGLDNIDENAAKELGIQLMNAPEGNCETVAEHVVGMLLMLFNKLHQANAEVRAGIWHREANRGVEIRGKNIGIIGYGHNGSATARLLGAFGAKVFAYDKYKTGFGTDLIRESSLEMLFEKADILSLHIPLTHETRGMINAAFIHQFQKPIVLVNAARGEVLSLTDLVAALESGKIKGACLDVLENEKPEQWSAELMEALFAKKQVVFSPHVAGWSTESYRRISEVLFQKINNFIETSTKA